MTFAIDAAVRSGAIVLVGLLLHRLLRHRSAALRHRLLVTTLLAAATVAPLTLLMPDWHVPVALPGDRAAAIPTTADAPGLTAPTAPGHLQATGQRTLLSWASLLWVAGLVAGLARLATGWWRLAEVTSRAEPVREGILADVAGRLAGAYGLPRPVALLQTDSPDLLATWGLCRPVVLLPVEAHQWDEHRVHVVLCHEFAHVERRDWLVQTAAEALRIAYWFNPLFWMACASLREDSEQACDDAVLGAGVPANEYAAQLLMLARAHSPHEGIASGPATPMARRSTLERRITAMLNPTADRRTPTRLATAAIAGLLALATLPAAAARTGGNEPRPLEGSVYDASGAVLPGVELALEADGKVVFETTTDGAGYFTFPIVEPGRYVLRVSQAGFRSLRQELTLADGRDWNRAITLQVGDVRESIVVREQRPERATPETTAAPAPVRVGGNLRPPRKLVDVKPVYPATMRDAGREGVVPIEATIARDGSVDSARVLTAQVHPDFAIAAVEAVKQWRFDPTLLNGVPVEVVMRVTVEFELSD